MYSVPFKNVDIVKHTRKKNDMSYTFGPHTRRKGAYVVYAGDGRVVKQDPDAIPAPLHATPRWLIADWIIADSEGQPLSAQARAFLRSNALSHGLQWLHQYCQDR